jgi:hypothetical protein
VPGPAKPVSPHMIARPPSKHRGCKLGLVKVDGRTLEARLLKYTRQALLDHVGPNPTTLQLSLIERAAWLELKCALFDKRTIEGTFTEADSAIFLATIGGLRRIYKELGIERAGPKFADLLQKRPVGRPLGAHDTQPRRRKTSSS